MKKRLMKRGAILLSLAMVLSLVGLGPVGVKDAQAAKKVKLAKSKITVTVGKSKTVKIKNIKKKQVKKLTVKSKKKAIATVKKSGKIAIKVTGKKKGSTTVVANLKLKKKVGGKKKYTLKLKVTVKKSAPTPTTAPPAPTATPDTRTPTTVKTVELKDMTYYIGQTPVPPLDASKTTVTPVEAATGGAVTYQWYMDPATGSAVAVATTAQYTPDITKAGTFSVYYTAKFAPTEQYKKTYQESSATSNKATITVLEKVPITFDANGGTFGTGTDAKTVLKKEYEWGKDLGTLPLESEMSPPSNTTGGRDLLGWATTKTAPSGNVYSTTKAKEAVTYYAVWGTRPPDTSSYTPPSAPTPQNVTIEYNPDGLQCSATVSDGGIPTFQWYQINQDGVTMSVSAEMGGNSSYISAQNSRECFGSIIYVVATYSKAGYTASSASSPQYAFVVFDANGATGHYSGNYIGNELNDTSITESIVFKSINSYLAIGEIPANAKANDGSAEATQGWVPIGETTAVSTSTQITGPLTCVPKWTS